MNIRRNKVAITIVIAVMFICAQTLCYATGMTDTITNTANNATNTVTDAGNTVNTAAGNAANTANNTVTSAQAAVAAAKDEANSAVGLAISSAQNLTTQATLVKLGASTLTAGNAVSKLGAGLLGNSAVTDLDTALATLTAQTKNNTISVNAIEAVDTAMQATQPAVQAQLNQLQTNNAITAEQATLLQQSVLDIGAASRANAALQSGATDTGITGVLNSQAAITQSYGTMVHNACASNNITMPTAAEKTALANQLLATSIAATATTAVTTATDTANTAVNTATNTANTAVTNATATANTAITSGTTTAKAYTDPNVTNSGNQAVNFTNNSQSSAVNAANSLANYYINYWKNNSWDWLRRTQFSGSFANGSSPQWAISTIQPINSIEESLNRVWFGSGRYETNTSTMNLGLGYRQMNDAHSSAYGANVFYDNQFKVNDLGGGDTGSAMFQRVGVGLEYFTGPLEATANGYFGISAPVKVAENSTWQTWQNVANGFDVNLKSNFDYFRAPWLNLTLTGYQYYGTMPDSTMANGGHWAGLAAQIGWQITPQLSVNVGRDFGAQNTTAGFNFNLLAAPQPAMLWGDSTINSNATKDLSYKMLQQPQRNNTIMVEQYKIQKSFGSIQITVTDGTAAIAGATVTVNGISASQITNSNGIATFSNVPGGTYSGGSIVCDGYDAVTFSDQMTVSSGSVVALAKTMSPATTGTITGTVSGVTETSDITATLAGAAVPASNISWNRLTYTYSIRSSNAGTGLALALAKPGYTVAPATQLVNVTIGKTFDAQPVTFAPRTLVSIAVTPNPASMSLNSTQQFTAMGTYDDSSTPEDITGSVTWSSSDESVVTITSTGSATAGATAGNAVITATKGAMRGEADVTVSATTTIKLLTKQTDVGVFTFPDGVSGKIEAIAGNNYLVLTISDMTQPFTIIATKGDVTIDPTDAKDGDIYNFASGGTVGVFCVENCYTLTDEKRFFVATSGTTALYRYLSSQEGNWALNGSTTGTFSSVSMTGSCYGVGLDTSNTTTEPTYKSMVLNVLKLSHVN